MLVVLVAAASAACRISQGQGANMVEVQLEVQGNPRACQRLFLDSAQIQEVRGWIGYPEGGSRKLKKDYIALKPGGSWEIIAPELQDGGRLLVQASINPEIPDPTGFTISFRPVPPGVSALERLDQRWTLELDPRHPGWSFADPTRGNTHIEASYQLLPGAASERFAIPTDTSPEGSGFLHYPGLVLSQEDLVQVHYQQPGTPAQGILWLPPGSFTLLAPIEWLFGLPFGATQSPVEGGVRIELMEAGELRFRALSTGNTPIIPDIQTWAAGMTERFRTASLPEPAVPVWLRAVEDRALLHQSLFELVQALVDVAIPGQEPLKPRGLNHAWRSGFGSPVEQGLILQRLLNQERFGAFWALTGEKPDLVTLTGFDAVVVQSEAGWLDPSCGVCAAGEVSSRYAGKPVVFSDGHTDTLPDTGTLERSLILVDTSFNAVFVLSGTHAVWLREAVEALDPPAIPNKIATLLGAAGGKILELTGLEEKGASIKVHIQSDHPPHPEALKDRL
jgi:hypothetical protein